MNGNNLKYFFVGAFVVASGLWVLAVTIPNAFAPGTPIKSAEVNANFSALKSAVDPLQAFTAKLSTTPCASGQAMGGVGADGTPNCVAVSGGAGLVKVEHDTSLAGEGTAGTPLGVAVPLALEKTGGQVLDLSGGGVGIPGATLRVRNTNPSSGIGAEITSLGGDAALVLQKQSAGGQLLKAFGSNGGEDEFRIDDNGTVTLRKPNNTPNITLDNSNGSISANGLNFPSSVSQKLNLWGSPGSDYGIGIQNATMYYRVDAHAGGGGFAWYRGGAHSDNTFDPGGGTTLMTLSRSGELKASGIEARTGDAVAISGTNNSSSCTLCVSQAGSGDVIRAWGRESIFPKFWVDTDGNVNTVAQYYGKGYNNNSDRSAKTNFADVNPLKVLEQLSRVPIQSWNYKTDPTSVRHIGPMAQDFKAAFGLNGEDDRHISSIDAQGVALAAIQGLYELNRQLKSENKALQDRLAALEKQLSSLKALEQRLAALEAR
ncbi:tail fiber domain-containing protein [Calidithermus roseus]|uniref:Chaperone of endosialidase n=1 Tax=Calidithermus roseus TaxID=1644118 RepID=A0A399EUY6_9DEIN|nr:tail fiber domain-containing protein [Calidithermus roseus]RIH88437.1 Chaperone of endosialidase [Calidithermus roseus]